MANKSISFLLRTLPANSFDVSNPPARSRLDIFFTDNFPRVYEYGLKALEIDPSSPVGYGLVAFHSWINADYEEAIRHWKVVRPKIFR